MRISTVQRLVKAGSKCYDKFLLFAHIEIYLCGCVPMILWCKLNINIGLICLNLGTEVVATMALLIAMYVRNISVLLYLIIKVMSTKYRLIFCS